MLRTLVFSPLQTSRRSRRSHLWTISCKPRRRPMDKLIWLLASCPIAWVRIQSAWFTDDLLKWLWDNGSKIAPQSLGGDYLFKLSSSTILWTQDFRIHLVQGPLQSHFPCSSCTLIPFPHWIKRQWQKQSLVWNIQGPSTSEFCGDLRWSIARRMMNPGLLQQVRNTSNIGNISDSSNLGNARL